jgi:hypothetical protein
MRPISITTKHFLSEDGKRVASTKKTWKFFGITIITKQHFYPETAEYTVFDM